MGTRRFSLRTRAEYLEQRSRRVVQQAERDNRPTLRQLVAEVQRQAMGGVMPSREVFDLCKPAHWPQASVIEGGAVVGMPMGISWEHLAREAGLKVSR